MSAKIGLNGKLYYSATLMGATPVWVLVPNCRDLSLKMEIGEADVSTRASLYKMYLAAMIDVAVEFEMVWDNADAGQVAIRTAALAGTPLAFAVMDNLIATSGAQGLQADMILTGFSREEPLEDGMTVPISLKPAYSSTPPAWVTVT